MSCRTCTAVRDAYARLRRLANSKVPAKVPKKK